MSCVIALIAGALISALADRLLGVEIESFWIGVAHKVVYMLFGVALYMVSRG